MVGVGTAKSVARLGWFAKTDDTEAGKEEKDTRVREGSNSIKGRGKTTGVTTETSWEEEEWCKVEEIEEWGNITSSKTTWRDMYKWPINNIGKDSLCAKCNTPEKAFNKTVICHDYIVKRKENKGTHKFPSLV